MALKELEINGRILQDQTWMDHKKKKRKWGQSQQFLTILLSDFSGEKVHVLSHVPVQS